MLIFFLIFCPFIDTPRAPEYKTFYHSTFLPDSNCLLAAARPLGRDLRLFAELCCRNIQCSFVHSWIRSSHRLTNGSNLFGPRNILRYIKSTLFPMCARSRLFSLPHPSESDRLGSRYKSFELLHSKLTTNDNPLKVRIHFDYVFPLLDDTATC